MCPCGSLYLSANVAQNGNKWVQVEQRRNIDSCSEALIQKYWQPMWAENNGRTKTMGTKLLSEEPETRKFSGKPESLEKTEAETIISQFVVSSSILRDRASGGQSQNKIGEKPEPGKIETSLV